MMNDEFLNSTGKFRFYFKTLTKNKLHHTSYIIHHSSFIIHFFFVFGGAADFSAGILSKILSLGGVVRALPLLTDACEAEGVVWVMVVVVMGDWPGAGPEERRLTNLRRISNQNVAPSEMPMAVVSQPMILYSHHLPFMVCQLTVSQPRPSGDSSAAILSFTRVPIF